MKGVPLEPLVLLLPLLWLLELLPPSVPVVVELLLHASAAMPIVSALTAPRTQAIDPDFITLCLSMELLRGRAASEYE